MRSFMFLMLVWATTQVGADAPADAALPVTIDERNIACVQAEDGDPARAIALAQSVLDEGTALSALQRAEALGCRGWSQAATGRKEEARRDAYALRELVRSFAASADRVRLTRRAGGILHRSDDRVGAVDLYAQAVADAEAQGLEAERIPLLANLGVLHSEFEEHARAQVNYEQALALMDRLDDHRHEAPVRYNLSLNLLGQDRHADAIPHLRRTLELVRDHGMGGPMQELGTSLALADALLETGKNVEAQTLLDRAKVIQLQARDPSIDIQLNLLEASQRAAAGDLSGALTQVDSVDASKLTDIHRWDVLKIRADLLERLGRFAQATKVLHDINALRETYLRHQNHERLAALDAHMRDREQRLELERLQANADVQARQLEVRARLQQATVIVAGLLLLFGSGVLLWQRRMNHRLYLASHTDPLTGLANRREMTNHLRALSMQAQGSSGLLLIDIDLFKRINDEHGHDIGDQVLIAYAQRLRSGAGEGAIVSRWGGEEFIVLLPHSDVERVRATADRLRVLLAQPIDTIEGPLHTAASFGYANLPLPGSQNPDGWHHSVQLADSALYLAKRAGRDAWAGYWIEHEIPDWPAERLGREPHLARSLQVITPQSSRPLREAVVAVAAN